MTDKEEVCQLTIKNHPVVNSEQEEEIVELNDPQDDVEQYTRKNPLEIHGILESAYTSTKVVLKLAGAINVAVNPEDIEISRKLIRKGVKSNHRNIPKSRGH